MAIPLFAHIQTARADIIRPTVLTYKPISTSFGVFSLSFVAIIWKWRKEFWSLHMSDSCIWWWGDRDFAFWRNCNSFIAICCLSIVTVIHGARRESNIYSDFHWFGCIWRLMWIWWNGSGFHFTWKFHINFYGISVFFFVTRLVTYRWNRFTIYNFM